jgi:extracellular matrix regulatory protein A
MSIELVHVGFNNIIVMNNVIAIASPNSAPTKRTVQESKQKGSLIDLTNGRRTKAVIINNSGHVILSALTPETIVSRYRQIEQKDSQLDEEPELID